MNIFRYMGIGIIEMAENMNIMKDKMMRLIKDIANKKDAIAGKKQALSSIFEGGWICV